MIRSQFGLFFVTVFASLTLNTKASQLQIHGQDSDSFETTQGDTLLPPFLSSNHLKWADSVLLTLSLSDQIAQLLMPPVYAHKDQQGWTEAEEWARNGDIGGVICMQGHPQGQMERLRRLQSA